MKHDEILASVSVLVLAGVIVYATKVGLITTGNLLNKSSKISTSQSFDSASIQAVGGDPNALLSGPSIYLSNAPYPFWPPVGNVLPPNNSSGTIGVANGDFLGFMSS
jgi:hypothetical protein